MNYRLDIQYRVSGPSGIPGSYRIYVSQTEQPVRGFESIGNTCNDITNYYGVFASLRDLFDAAREYLGFRASLIEVRDIGDIEWRIIPTVDIPKALKSDRPVRVIASMDGIGVIYNHDAL